METEDVTILKEKARWVVIKASIATAVTFMCMVVGFVTIFQLVLLSDTEISPSPSIELSRSCERSNGLLVEGVNQHGDGYNRFSICVPYEALTCIDVE